LAALGRVRGSGFAGALLANQTYLREIKMATTKKSPRNRPAAPAVPELWPGIDAQFRLIIVAAQRSKQLVRGATARIEPDPLRRRNTSIALEEVKRGLVPFKIFDPNLDTDQVAE
jgi:DNA-directed RNA polymerase omega subunit